MSPSSPINGDNVTTETRKRSDMSHSVSPPNAPSSSSAGTGKRKRSQSVSPGSPKAKRQAPGTRKRSKSVSSDEGSSKSAYVCSGEFDDTSASDSNNGDLDNNNGECTNY